jgi:hypothetical protein
MEKQRQPDGGWRTLKRERPADVENFFCKFPENEI